MYLILLALACAYLVAPLVIGPFYLKFKHWVSAQTELKAVAPETLSDAVRDHIDAAKSEFQALGFGFIGYRNLPGYAPGVLSSFGLFYHEERKTAAMAAAIQHEVGNTVEYCELTCRYADGSVVNVSNSPMLSAYRDPGKRNYRYPKIQSVRELSAISDWIARRDGRTGGLVGLSKSRESEMIGEALKNELRRQEEYGYYFMDVPGRRYRLTWKGAIVMTVKHVFPVKQILNLLDLRAAGKAIEGMKAGEP